MSVGASVVGVWQRFREELPPKGHRAGTSLGGRPTYFLVRRGDGDLPSLAKWEAGFEALYVAFEPFTSGVRGYRGTYHELSEVVGGGWQWLTLPEGT